MWGWTLGQMTPGRGATVTRIAADVSGKVTGYMAGNLLTSLIAGTVVFVALLILGVPFPLLWGLWVALGGLPANNKQGAGRHPHRPVRVHHRGPHRGHRHRGRLRRLHPDREPRPEPGGHEQDGPDRTRCLVFIAVLAGASLGSLIGGIFGGFVAALLAIPTAGALQVLVEGVGRPPGRTSPRKPRRLRPSPRNQRSSEASGLVCPPVISRGVLYRSNTRLSG